MRTNSLTDSMQKEVNDRLWHFVEQHGGTQTVAKAVGVSVQTMYNIRDNRTFPSAGTLALIKQAYPAVDINAFVSSEQMSPIPQVIGDLNAAALQQQLEQAQAQIAKLQQRNEKLEDKNDKLTMALLERAHPNLFADKEGVKIGSDYHLTEAVYRINPANVPFVVQG